MMKQILTKRMQSRTDNIIIDSKKKYVIANYLYNNINNIFRRKVRISNLKIENSESDSI